ncbi:MAG: hypothetical protein KDD73_09855 [Anaerolineales bacterium]|nr:hypothetical protein [Anaerolineales bacterium]MCB9127060.1 hypothetical protein [Ardenticatenales bacterium]MCB9172415.1 hypothetical protein [Ardenticatenales bacterium]
MRFLEGYRSVRAISDEALQWMPLMLRVHHVVTFAKLHRTLTPAPPEGEVASLARLRVRLLEKMQAYRVGFASWA